MVMIAALPEEVVVTYLTMAAQRAGTKLETRQSG